MLMTGMVIVASVPLMPGGKQVSLRLSATMRPIAPAACAFCALSTNVQLPLIGPRSTSAHLPWTALALVYALQPSVVLGPTVSAASSAGTMSPVSVRLATLSPNDAVPMSKRCAIALGALTERMVIGLRYVAACVLTSEPSHARWPVLIIERRR